MTVDNVAIKRKELTFTAIILGVLLAVVFGAANAYLGLRVGLTVSASVPAAVISMGVLRFVLRRDSILENNMVQTIGSAGESLAAGAIFTLPVLFLWAMNNADCAKLFPVDAEFWSVDFWLKVLLPITSIALAGGLLGVLFMVPLRRPLVVDEEKTLIYPEGRACADVLRAGEAGARRAGIVFAGFGGAMVLKFVTGWLKWIPETFFYPFRRLGGALGFEISPALLGVGYVVGPKISATLLAGALLGWMVLLPLCCQLPDSVAAFAEHKDYADALMYVWRHHVRYIGAGAIAMGGFLSLMKAAPVFVRSLLKRGGAATLAKAEETGETNRDLSMRLVIGGIAVAVLFIWVVPAVPVGFLGAVLIALFGFFFAAVSARMVGLVGSSNNPISGMTIATLVVASLAIKATGAVGAVGMIASIAVGSVVCIVAAIAGDTAQDLKTGRMLGATPWKQQVGEFLGVIASAAVIGVVLVLLHKAWGFGSKDISAPQASLMKDIVEGVMGGSLPWDLLLMGVVLAVVLSLCQVPVMPFAIGIYLPIQLNVTIFAGGVVKWLVERKYGQRGEGEDPGTLLSAGLIAGEGLCGILLAVFALVCS